VTEPFTVESFLPLIDHSFTVVAPGLDGFALQLVSARTRGEAPPVDESGARSPFTLTFRGPGVGILPQGTYRLENDVLQLDLFIVPLAPDADGPRYEAIFA
jgi:hypothetical protein